MTNHDNSQMLPVGTLLDGRYRIEKYLASGGFGNTYVAVFTRFNRRVAIKEFFMRGTNHRDADHSTVVVSNAANQAAFDQQLDKFRREAKRIFDMRNDHIVHVIDLFDANGTSYYVMDYIEGESLSARVKRGPLTETEVRDVATQLLDALNAVHKAGFYHLDVKPGNIMMDRKGHCTLIDFGASKQMSAMERTSMSASGMAYTPGYAPIEQEGQRLKSIGPWTDFYAVGATLYNLLTSCRPPEVEPYDTADDSRMFDYPEGVSLTMRRAISRMMNPDIRKRPQNVDQMKAVMEGRDFVASADGGTVQATPRLRAGADASDDIVSATDATPAGQPYDSQEAGSRSKRKPWMVWAAVAAVACLAAVLLLVIKPGGKDAGTTVQPFGDKSFTVGNTSFTMKAVEGGTFTMGFTSDQGKKEEWESNDNTPHKVTLSDYRIGETEVTQVLWKAVMDTNPSYFKGDSRPVETVSWDDCQTFIRKLNAATEGQRPEGREFRLPTEAEWEFAARGGNKSNHTKYAGGNNLGSVAWFSDNSNNETHPVAKKSPNELGLYDMSGNVWEWCQDWYDENYYGKSPQNDPCNNTKASYRVGRGGSWFNGAGGCRVSFRSYYSPGSASDLLGLRLAL